MGLIVQKFGGTSVGDLERMQKVAEIVASTKAQGHDVIVVVSAMSGETDRLIKLASVASTMPSPREYDALLATGEQVSAALLSIALMEKQFSSKSYTGSQVAIRTDSRHRKANILDVQTQALREDIQAGCIPVVAGFQGIDPQGQVTTLGRGGSDMTAVALAAALAADECQIFTDVEGVFTSDPRVVQNARCLDQITFDEMLELSSLGAKVLQIRAVEFAHKFNVPVRVLSTFANSAGTLIKDDSLDTDKPVVSGIAFDRDQAKITLQGLQGGPESGSVADVLDALDQAGIEVDMIVQNVAHDDATIDFSFTVHLDEYQETKEIIQRLTGKLPIDKTHFDANIAKLSLVGVGMTTHAGVAAKMLHALDAESIAVQLITSSEIKISVVIDEKYMELGARALHTAFELDRQNNLQL